MVSQYLIELMSDLVSYLIISLLDPRLHMFKDTLPKLPKALRKQDYDVVAPYITREHRPDRFSPGYDLWPMDPSGNPGDRASIPNRHIAARNEELLDRLVYQASYRDDRGAFYQNETFLHIAGRVMARSPLVVKYRRSLPQQLLWQDESVAPHYLLNAVDHTVSA